MENSRGEARGVPKSSPSKVSKWNSENLLSYNLYRTCISGNIMIEKNSILIIGRSGNLPGVWKLPRSAYK